MATQSQPPHSSNAFSFISKGWREVRDSADADLRLMRDRANSFKNLATSFDRELENFLNSAPPVPSIRSSPPAEIEFVRNKLQPKLSEIRRAYSSPDFSKKVLDKWKPKSTIRIDLSAIKNAIVSEVEDTEGFVDLDRVSRGRRLNFKDFWGEWKPYSESEADAEGPSTSDWEPLRSWKTNLKELEKRSSSTDIFSGFKNSELMEKVKSSMVCTMSLSCFYSCISASSACILFIPAFVDLFIF